MRNASTYILTLLLTLILQSCTHNNGDIGPYFGTWKLSAIEVDGSNMDSYKGNIFWQFQAEVFCMREVLPNHDTNVCWGSWKEASDGILELNFTHSDDSHPAGSTYYSPFIITGLQPAVNRLDIKSKSGTRLTLSYIDSEGKSYTYRLIKW